MPAEQQFSMDIKKKKNRGQANVHPTTSQRRAEVRTHLNSETTAKK